MALRDFIQSLRDKTDLDEKVINFINKPRQSQPSPTQQAYRPQPINIKRAVNTAGQAASMTNPAVAARTIGGNDDVMSILNRGTQILNNAMQSSPSQSLLNRKFSVGGVLPGISGGAETPWTNQQVLGGVATAAREILPRRLHEFQQALDRSTDIVSYDKQKDPFKAAVFGEEPMYNVADTRKPASKWLIQKGLSPEQAQAISTGGWVALALLDTLVPGKEQAGKRLISTISKVDDVADATKIYNRLDDEAKAVLKAMQDDPKNPVNSLEDLWRVTHGESITNKATKITDDIARNFERSEDMSPTKRKVNDLLENLRQQNKKQGTITTAVDDIPRKTAVDDLPVSQSRRDAFFKALAPEPGTASKGFIDFGAKVTLRGNKLDEVTDGIYAILREAQAPDEAVRAVRELMDEAVARGDTQLFQGLKRAAQQYKSDLVTGRGLPRDPVNEGIIKSLDEVLGTTIKQVQNQAKSLKGRPNVSSTNIVSQSSNLPKGRVATITKQSKPITVKAPTTVVEPVNATISRFAPDGQVAPNASQANDAYVKFQKAMNLPENTSAAQSTRQIVKNLSSDAQAGLSEAVTPVGKTVSSSKVTRIMPQKPRGFTTSVKESEKVSPTVKKQVNEVYTPKPNKQLMGEAKALLNEGASIKFDKVKNLDQKVAATIQEAINLDKAGKHDEAAFLYNNLAEMGTEMGRGSQAFSLLEKMSPEAVSISIARKIKGYNETALRRIPELTAEQQKQISNMIDEIRKLPLGSRERALKTNDLEQVVNAFIPSSLIDKAIAVWKAGLLTSLRTHERNLIGNTIHGAAEVAKDVPASIVDQVLAAKTGKRTLTFTTRGTGKGAKTGGGAAKDYLIHGFDPENAINKYDVKKITWGNNPAEKVLKGFTESVFRTLGAADKPFYHAAYARSLYNQAGAMAINAGKRGNRKYIEALVKNPTTEMKQLALQDAEVATFKNSNRLSKLARSAKKQLGPAGEVLAPFTGVPSSIAGQIIAYSPIGLIKGSFNSARVLATDVPALQRQAAQEIGRGVIGTGLFGIGAYLAQKGLMTGQPKDKNESLQWELEGKKRNSVLINGKWRNIGSIGPENLVMLAGGKAMEELGPQGGGAGELAAGLGQDFMAQTMLQGVQGSLNAISDPGRYGKYYWQGLAGSVVPNIVADTSKAFDPTARQANTIPEAIQARVPFARNKLLPRQDTLGNDIAQNPTGISAFIDLFSSSAPISNTVVDELSRLNAAGFNAVPSKLDKTQTINGEPMTLTPAQLTNLNTQSGKAISENLEALFADPAYQKLSDQDKQAAIDDMVTKTRKIVRANIDIDNPESTVASTGKTQTQSGGRTYTIISDSGNVTKINLDEPIEKPQLTGNTELDKKLVSKYKSAITKRKNDIVKLYEDGQIDAKTAEEELAKLNTLYSSAGGGTAKKMKKISLPTPKKAPVIKISSRSSKSSSIPKVKTIKAPTIKNTTSGSGSYKIATFKPKPLTVKFSKKPTLTG